MARLKTSSYVKIVLIILLCLLICGTLTGGLAFLHRGMDSWTSSWDRWNQSWEADADVSTGSFSVDASSVDDISINWLAGKVSVDVVEDSETGGQIQVSETENSRPSLPLRWRNDAGKLEIDYGHTQGINACSMLYHKGKDLQVLIPESIASALEDFELNAASGEYLINGLDCCSLAVNQASGNVQLDGCAAESAAFDIASGMLYYNGKVSGDLSVDQASGNAQIRIEGSNPRSSDLTLASGELRIMLPVADFYVELSKMSGAFNSDFDLLSNGDTFYCDPERNSIEGRSGSAAQRESSQPRIVMDMMSGNFFIGRS